MRAYTSVLALLCICCISVSQGAVEYYGKFIAPLSNYHHEVSGDVYAVDARTLHIRNFNYDGQGPAAYFYVGHTKVVNGNGHRLQDERGMSQPLKRYRRRHITLTLPEGKTLANIKWFAVWCDEASVNFGDVKIPKNLDFPRPQKLAQLNGVHAVSSEPVVVVDAQTLLIPSFSYDGEAPDAKFWVGRGSKPSPQGIRVPDENGKEIPLRRYDRKTIVLTLPGDLTVFEIGHFGVWCEAFTVDFGHIQIPSGLNVPPSLKMLGVSPQSKLNCEVLHEDLAFEVRWAVAGDSIVVQLVAKLENGEYMSFGVSGHERKNQMIGADVVVAWVDHATLNGYAVDYFLDDKSQCSGTRGSCPDYRIEPDNTSSVRLLNAALVNGYSIVTYQRPLRAHDSLDRPILTNTSQAVIWGVGPLNQKQEVSFHSVWSKENILLDFGRTPQWNCPIPESDAALAASTHEQPEDVHGASSTAHGQDNTHGQVVGDLHQTPPPPAAAVRQSDAWEIPPIQCNEPDDGVFYAQMGPTGGKRGYPSITKHVGWGISYYINGLLIPEINVVRGKTYTFVVEGGLDPSIPAKYHPFYITDDPVGGYANKSPEEQKKVRIFAGVEQTRSGVLVPTGVGRLCNWTPDPEQPPADEFVSFGAYQRTLTLICDHGEPGVIQWTPDEDTPDTVFYQCFTHRHLGWKINVHDRCDLPVVSASEPVETRVKYEPDEDELESHPSQRVATRIKPEGPNYLPLVSNVGLKNQDLMAEYKKNFAQIPVNFQVSPDQKYELQHGIPSNHKYPASTMDVYINKQIESSTEDGREMIPVSEDTSQDVSTERNRPILPQGQDKYNVSETNHHQQQESYKPAFNRNPHPHGMRPGPHQRRPVMSTMTIIRPHRRPAPHHHMMMVAKPVMHRPYTLMSAPSQYRPVYVKKPIYRMPAVSMHRPVMMVPQSVHAETVMMPPRAPITQSHSPVTKTVSVSYSSSKGKVKPQIPMQMKSEPSENKKYILPQHKPYKPENSAPQYKISQSITTGGFNPGSLVIEGGFKPIIQNTQEAQDRISETEETDDTEGTIDLTADEIPKEINIDTKATEYFEPMFIPSPPDSMQKHAKKPTGLEYDVLDKKKAYTSRKPVRQNMIVIRRRPISPSSRSQEDSLDETPMAAERMDTYYLPPSGPIYGVSQSGQVAIPANIDSGTPTLLTYDGKPVSGNNVVPPPLNHGTLKRKSSSAELLRSTPQFGPFRGDVPPPVPDNIRPENIPQLKFKSDKRPAHAMALTLNPAPSTPQGRTQLSVIRPVEEEEDADGLIPEASELEEYKYDVSEGDDSSTGKDNVIIVLAETLKNGTAMTQDDREVHSTKETSKDVGEKSHVQKRDRRSAHNVPVSGDDSDEMHHNHDHHKMMENGTLSRNDGLRITTKPTFVIVNLLFFVYYML
ncbi:protein Skeletor, isoforms D/E-like [Macrosteles quadrilineatus]|uniref:protein Skeletor, isoforms D/E-like n=1 Tax=Macrosteles quadrilineatus TaxID=74068 RepID=UPI0023E1010E|nr:protein Skeletor, isoforms D/E-like [Macrosteles quadrilineatus]